MKSIGKITAAVLTLCILFSGCGNAADSQSAPENTPESRLESTLESEPVSQQKTAILYTMQPAGSSSPEIKEYPLQYSGELTADVLTKGLSQLTGMDFSVTAVGRRDGVSVDWAPASTLLANPESLGQKEGFRFSDSGSMCWFMLDSLSMTLSKNLNAENVYYTMDGGKDLVMKDLVPVQKFQGNLPYMGSTFYFVHAGGTGKAISDADATKLLKSAMIALNDASPVIVSGGNDTVAGTHALTFSTGENSADGKKFTALNQYAVTDSGAVYYIDLVQGPEWILLESDAKA